MIVCICHGITERDIEAAVQAGAHDASSVRAELGCGSTCGSCLSEVENIVRSQRFSIPVLSSHFPLASNAPPATL
jgi:bacterioferritin-associated ferredoxin